MRDTYLSNPRLKAVGVPVRMSTKQVEEYVRCGRDFEHFIRNWVRIVHVDRGIIKFDMWDWQRDMVQTMIDSRFTIAKIGRQSGKSVTTIAFLLWTILFNENQSIALLAHKADQARELLGRLKASYELLPKWMQQGVKTWNKGSIELENGCYIIASSTSSSSIRGRTMNIVYLDEFGVVPMHLQQDFFASVFPTISSGKTTKVIITSTPKGLNLFYKIWMDSVKGRNDYRRIDVHWSQVPGRDEAWKREMIRNTSEEQFREEFETEFLGSSATLISAEKLTAMAGADPVRTGMGVKYFEERRPSRSYVVTVDVGTGTGQDPSAFVVFDVTAMPYRVVSTFHSNRVPPIVLARYVQDVSNYYNQASILVETIDVGLQVAEILQYDLEYDGIISTTNVGFGKTTVSGGFAGKTNPGIRTNRATKRIGCSNLKTLIEKDRLIVECEDTINELKRFVLIGSSYEAEDGHDDLAMCLVQFAWLAAQRYFRETGEHDPIQRIYGEAELDDLIPFVVDDGRSAIEEYKPVVEVSIRDFDRLLFG